MSQVRRSELWRAFVDLTAARPTAPAVIEAVGGHAWTRAEIRAAAEARADGLPHEGAVAFSAVPSARWLVDFLAIQRVGVTAVPVDPAATDWREEAARLGATHALDEAGVTALVPATPRNWRGIAVAKVTSGSTGGPAVIACRSAHLLADGRNIIATMGIRAADRNLAVLPLGHSYALGNVVMPLLLQGTAMVVADAYAPRQLVEWIVAHRVTVFPAVPVLLRVLAEIAGDERPWSLRLVISAGAPLPPEVARQFTARFGRRVHNFYGSSETGGICYDRAGWASRSGRSVGRPLNNVSVGLAADGRVRVSSAAVAMPRGSFTLPDLGEWTADGELRILGRATQVANIGGRKVSPVEVERVLLTLPGVTAARVTIETHGARETLAAIVESREQPAPLREALAARLPAWKLPRRIVALPEWPRTPRGKVDRLAIERLLVQG